jgi:Uma2 family endonuclease
MTTATTMIPSSMATETDGDGDQCVVLRDVGWKGYCALLRMRGERTIPRMVYLDGSVFLMSPSFAHENIKERLGQFVMVLVEELHVPCIMAGSTTFRRRLKRGGVEGDQSFYLTNCARIRGKKKLSLKVDPPPDLAIEAVVTHTADEAVEVYRRFRVPEVWVCEKDRFEILVLQESGRYLAAERSLAFPFLEASEIHAWVFRDQDENDTEWITELRRWVQEVLVPRHRQLTTGESTPTTKVDGPETPTNQV